MELSVRPPRISSRPSASIQRQLNMYAIAAGAAGVGMLALASPAEAKIIYTPTDVTIVAADRCRLDLNHDGIADFTLSHWSVSLSWTFQSFLSAIPAAGNGVRGCFDALALKAGAKIGTAASFCGHLMAAHYPDGDVGLWRNVKNRYLGLEFKIKGETHYGWARLSVLVENQIIGTASLTGYAYETLPNRIIIAGQTKGAEVVAAQAACLGRLARGSARPLGKVGTHP